MFHLFNQKHQNMIAIVRFIRKTTRKIPAMAWCQFMLLAFIHLFKFLNHNMEARYFELPLIVGYAIITNLNFFAEMKKGMVILMSIVSIILIFILAAFIPDELINWLY
jgi:hypothetical protein